MMVLTCQAPMDKVTTKYDSHEEADEAERKYYLSLTPKERINILIEIVRPEVEAHYAASRGLARVCRVTDLGSN
jgi:hypothetical protein